MNRAEHDKLWDVVVGGWHPDPELATPTSPHIIYVHLSARGGYRSMRMRTFHTSTPKEIATMLLDCYLAKKDMKKMLEFIAESPSLSGFEYWDTWEDAAEELEMAFPHEERPVWQCSLSRYKDTDRKVRLILASIGQHPVEVLCVTHTFANPYMFET